MAHPHRRPRASLTSPPPTSSTASFPTTASPVLPGADDISLLTLPEVRDRLARNTRVLNTGLFATPPPAIPSPPIASSSAAPGRPFQSAGTSPTDSVRERLLGVRRQLLEREKELLMLQTAEGMGGLQLGGVEAGHPSPVVQNGTAGTSSNGMKGAEDMDEDEEEAESSSMAGRRHSAPRVPPSQANGQAGKASGKRAAMMNIQQREKGYAPNGLILYAFPTSYRSTLTHRPVSESIALASRDFDHQTASRLSSLSLGPAGYGLDMGSIPRASSSPKSRRNRALAYPDDTAANLARGRAGEDENARAQALARVNAFMSYKSRYDDEDDEDEGEMFDGVDGDGVDGMFDFEEPDYPESSALDGGNRGAEGGKGKRRERGTGEVVDLYGEDDERFAEGNDDDEGDEGGGGMEYAT